VKKPASLQTFREHPLVRHPLVRRITGYSAGSVIAVIVSEAAFAATLGWGQTGTTIASAMGFVGGAVPNYILNRRWAWRDRRGRTRRSEVTLYMAVAFSSFIVSALVTHVVREGARHLTVDRGGQVAVTTAAYLGVSLVFFIIKFLIYETWVFQKHAAQPAAVAVVTSEPTGPVQVVRTASGSAECWTQADEALAREPVAAEAHPVSS
jgi:putative flippase GtrA